MKPLPDFDCPGLSTLFGNDWTSMSTFYLVGKCPSCGGPYILCGGLDKHGNFSDERIMCFSTNLTDCNDRPSMKSSVAYESYKMHAQDAGWDRLSWSELRSLLPMSNNAEERSTR